MSLEDLIGFVGVSLILVAYFLNLKQQLAPTDLAYILLNLVGAALACTASVMMQYFPFVLLEGVWTLVSLHALKEYLKSKNAKYEQRNH
ncbi:MAG: hypothetical protein AAF960_12140 [Bacteroidota bacterium]